MQRVVDRVLYDTETADQIAQYAPTTDKRDRFYLIETLYKTREGGYFLHAEGGPGTRYAKEVNGQRGIGKVLRPLTREGALDWCEERSIEGETVVKEFADLIENTTDN